MARPATELDLPPQVVASPAARDALARARAAENLVDLYDGRLRLALARAEAAAERERDRARLDARASIVLGSVESARRLAFPGSGEGAGQGSALSAGDALGRFVATAQAELQAARASLEERAVAEEALFEAESAALDGRLEQRARAILEVHRPRVELLVQPVGSERSLVHLARPEPDDAVLLTRVLAGRLPTRYDAFFDDSVDDLALPPARFYAEGGSASARPPTVDAEDALCVAGEAAFAPFKGMIPVRVPGHEFPRFRIVNHGPLAEVEAREAGGGYAPLMSRAAAELLTGLFLRLDVEGRIQLALRIS